MMSTLEANLDMSSTFLESPEITTWSLLAVSWPKTSGTFSGLRTIIDTGNPSLRQTCRTVRLFGQ